MELNFNNKKILIALSLLLLFIIITYLILARSGKYNNSGNLSPTPISDSLSSPILVKSKNLDDAPTLAPEQGGGLDTSSNVLKDSALNIEKIAPAIPYKKTFVSSVGIEVGILIPSVKYQENRWTLLVNISGIDFEVPPNTSDYSTMKIAFREGVADVFKFIKAQGANPEKIIIKWGGRLFIEERAAEWLNN